MQEVFFYFFLGMPAFFAESQDARYFEQGQHAIVKPCEAPMLKHNYSTENPVQIGDTVLVNIDRKGARYFGTLVAIAE